MSCSNYVPGCIELPASFFQIIQKIGSGSQGEAYLTRYQGHYVCAKIYKQTNEMMHEVLMLNAAQNSSCSPKLLGTCSSLRLVLMELVPGNTLQSLLRANPCRVIVHRIMIELGKAIEHLHFAGIIHNDLKFDNVMVSDDDLTSPRITLIDFGWAMFEGKSPYPHISSEDIDKFKHVCPKLALGGACDNSTDNYSFGVLLQTIASSYKCPLFAVLGRMLTQKGGIMLSLQNLLQYIREDYCKSCQQSCRCQACMKVLEEKNHRYRVVRCD